MERLGFEKYDDKNWFETKYDFQCSETGKTFYTTQYEYFTLKKTKISDYCHNVLEAYPKQTKVNKWYFF